MVFHQSFVTKKPVNVHCLYGTLFLNYAIASALAYIFYAVLYDLGCVNHYFVAKKHYTYSFTLKKGAGLVSKDRLPFVITSHAFGLFYHLSNRLLIGEILAIRKLSIRLKKSEIFGLNFLWGSLTSQADSHGAIWR